MVLIGQPNTGKTSWFNRLTGLRQRVGSYAGVTVERKQGSGMLEGVGSNVVDLPGTCSLSALSMDEHISVRALAGQPVFNVGVGGAMLLVWWRGMGQRKSTGCGGCGCVKPGQGRVVKEENGERRGEA